MKKDINTAIKIKVLGVNLGLFVIINILSGCFTSCLDEQELPITNKYGNNVTSTVTDGENNVYKTVTIGTQTWMAENLKSTKYNDGTSIPLVSNAYTWSTLSSGGYCWYNNSSTNKDVYGALYNWYAVNTGKLAPTGWHVATDAEWNILADFLGGYSVAGIALKETGTTHWQSPNYNATNISGFTGLPGSYCESNGTFSGITTWAAWWTSNEYIYDNTQAYLHALTIYDDTLNYYINFKKAGLSVRCVKNTTSSNVTLPILTTSSVSNITNTNAYCSGTIISDGGGAITAKGVYWNKTGVQPTGAPNGTYTNAGAGSTTFTSQLTGLVANSTYYVWAYATNSAGTMYGQMVSFKATTATVISGASVVYDGFTYHSVVIGTQTWMVENLRNTHYRDNTTIANVTANASWMSLTTAAWCDYSNLATNGTTYGHLYNWYAATSTRYLAPAGWHIPTSNEWVTLSSYLGGDAVAGNKLIDPFNSNWVPSVSGENYYGFSALPGGYRDSNGVLSSPGSIATFWTSSGGIRFLNTNTTTLSFGSVSNTYGCSLRCIKE